MTGYGPPDDPSEAPTGLYNYGRDGDEQPEPGSTPWYRRRAALIGLSALVAILLAVVIYEIVDLTHTGGSTTPSTSSTTSAAVTTTPPSPSNATTTEPAAPAPTTTLTEVPTTSAETTAAPTTTPSPSTSIDDGRHHRRHRDGTP
ncbi:MAG: hypothetical protein WBM01_11960 [Mycobacterium sp.]